MRSPPLVRGRTGHQGHGSVVFYANGLGDAIINRPAFSALCRNLPRPVRLIRGEDRGDFLWNGLDFDEIVVLAMHRRDDGGREFDVDAVPERFVGCDRFVSLVPWFSSSLTRLVARLGPTYSIGFGYGFDYSVPLDYRVNSVSLGFCIAQSLDMDTCLAHHRLPLRFAATPIEKVAALFGELARVGLHRVIGMHTETLAQKQWDASLFAKVACKVLSRTDDVVVLVVDYHASIPVCACHGHRWVQVPRLGLESAMHIVSRCHAFLGVDSCMLHAADLADVPGVLLFGPHTEPSEFGYFWSHGRHLRFRQRDDEQPVEEAVDALLAMLRRDERAGLAEGVP